MLSTYETGETPSGKVPYLSAIEGVIAPEDYREKARFSIDRGHQMDTLAETSPTLSHQVALSPFAPPAAANAAGSSGSLGPKPPTGRGRRTIRDSRLQWGATEPESTVRK